MGKRKPLKRRDDDGFDKPAYARGEVPEAKEEEPKAPARSSVQLEEALASDVAAKLMALKQSLEPAPQEPKEAVKRSPQVSSVRGRAAQEEEVSFEELLNPRDDTESFEALLEQSKLDWRFFKGDD